MRDLPAGMCTSFEGPGYLATARLQGPERKSKRETEKVHKRSGVDDVDSPSLFTAGLTLEPGRSLLFLSSHNLSFFSS